MAAVAPAIKAKPEDLTTTLSIVFLLNAIAVITFPLIGEWLNLTQEQFGTWAALAIHDTASVVGAASVVGEDAVEVAATLKLAKNVMDSSFGSFYQLGISSQKSKDRHYLFSSFSLFWL